MTEPAKMPCARCFRASEVEALVIGNDGEPCPRCGDTVELDAALDEEYPLLYGSVALMEKIP